MTPGAEKKDLLKESEIAQGIVFVFFLCNGFQAS